MVRGTPGRGSSPSPSSRRAGSRARYLVTVPRFTAPGTATRPVPGRRSGGERLAVVSACAGEPDGAAWNNQPGLADAYLL